MDVKGLFWALGGKLVNSWPVFDSEIYFTEKGTPYLKKPGVVTLAGPLFKDNTLEGFLNGFPAEFHFADYLKDNFPLSPATALSKFAGQLCYLSFGPQRTKNEKAENYFERIKREKHGSLLEHSCYSFLFYGVSRSLTHELVRHRAGFAFSQLSQRYVKNLRFVERPEYQSDLGLHLLFIERINRIKEEYDKVLNILEEKQSSGYQILRGKTETEKRKKAAQAGRAILNNEVEAPIVVTANLRAWRHFIEMRCSAEAEIEIRILAFLVFLCLAYLEPIIFNDYQPEKLEDGTIVLKTDYQKV